MDIPAKLYQGYIASLDFQVAQATTALGAFIDALDWDVDFYRKKELRNLVIQQAYGLLDIYGTAAAELAASMYDGLAIAAGQNLAEADLAELASEDSLAISMRTAARALWGANPSVEQFRENALASLKRYIKGAANDTVAKNALRDKRSAKGLRWARVPRGVETCSWCMMLASRGFVYVSESSAELCNHGHDHCDCDVVASFSDGTLEGYDFQQYKDFYYDNIVYDEYGHVDMDATSKNMRHALYEQNRDSINAKRREWYARNKEKEQARAAKWRETNQVGGINLTEQQATSVVFREKKSLKSGRVGYSQEELDEVISRRLPNLRFPVKPQYVSNLRSYGKVEATELIPHYPDAGYVVKSIKIGPQKNEIEDELVDTILHELLEARALVRGDARLAGGDAKMHPRINRIIARYGKIRRWT